MVDTSKIKTPLMDGEKIIAMQLGTIMTGKRDSGYLILTNQRLLWEKSMALNVAGTGVIGLINNAFTNVYLKDIVAIESAKVVASSAFVFSLSNGQTYKFSLNGSGHKESRDTIVNYIKTKEYENVVQEDEEQVHKNDSEQELIKEEIRYCTHCGNKVGEEAMFCAKCGQQIKSGNTAIPDEVKESKSSSSNYSTPIGTISGDDRSKNSPGKYKWDISLILLIMGIFFNILTKIIEWDSTLLYIVLVVVPLLGGSIYLAYNLATKVIKGQGGKSIGIRLGLSVILGGILFALIGSVTDEIYFSITSSNNVKKVNQTISSNNNSSDNDEQIFKGNNEQENSTDTSNYSPKYNIEEGVEKCVFALAYSVYLSDYVSLDIKEVSDFEILDKDDYGRYFTKITVEYAKGDDEKYSKTKYYSVVWDVAYDEDVDDWKFKHSKSAIVSDWDYTIDRAESTCKSNTNWGEPFEE